MTTAETLYAVTVNHQIAVTATRERAFLDENRTVALIKRLQTESGCVSVIPLSTCNRTEIYLEVRPGVDGAVLLRDALADVGADADVFFGDGARHLVGSEAIAHLYRVAAGLESMMLGEPQISAQLKSAYKLARRHQEPGPGLLRAFQGAFRAGKRVRTETRIGQGAVSVAFAAVELSRKFFTKLAQNRGLLVGAGETGALAARHFLQQDIGHLTVVNRSFDRAEDLAATLNEEWLRNLARGKGDLPRAADVDPARARVQARPWQDLDDALAAADVVLCTTGATEPVIRPDMVRQAVRRRRGNPLFLLDIAVPRDIHPDAAGIDGAYVYGLEDLDEIVEGNLSARRTQVPHALRIIDEELVNFETWLADIDLHPTVAEFKAYLEELKDKQVGFVRKRQSAEIAEAVDRSLQQFIKKVMGRSMSSLKRTDSPEERDRELQTLRKLFAPDSDDRP